MGTSRAHPAFDQLRTWLKEIEGAKTAAARGTTKHPIEKAPDSTEKPREGEQSADNERYIKEHVPDPVAGEAPVTKDQESQQLQIGTRKSETGGDPATENDYKDRPKNVETKHPANANLGEKYSVDLTTTAGIKKASESFSELANSILADIAVGAATPNTPKTASAPVPSPAAATAPPPGGAAVPSTEVPAKTAAATTEGTAEAGYELAKALGLSKEAADKNARLVIEDTIKQAHAHADRTARHLIDMFNREKAAGMEKCEKCGGEHEAGEACPKAKMAATKKKADGEEGGEPPPKPAGGDGATGGADALAALTGGAGADGAGGAPPGAGAPPPMGGGPGGPGGAPDQGQALQELAMALMELGIDPAQLAAAGAGGAGGPGGPPPMGGAGGPPPDMGGGAGGPPPGGMVPPPPPEGGGDAAKVASAVINYKRSGKFRVTEAKTAGERKLREQMKSYVRECVGL